MFLLSVLQAEFLSLKMAAAGAGVQLQVFFWIVLKAILSFFSCVWVVGHLGSRGVGSEPECSLHPFLMP